MTFTEENYLKAIYKLSENDTGTVSTNEISREMNTTAASVTDMLKKLKEKGFIIYEKYKGVNLSESGVKIATDLVRKHRVCWISREGNGFYRLLLLRHQCGARSHRQ